jgi:hypothetical protein
MDSDEVLTTDIGIAKLMNVGNFGAGDSTNRTFPTTFVPQALIFVERKNRFPHESGMDPNNSVRTVMVVNRSFVARSPADDEHLDRFIATNAMAPVIAFLESYVRLEIAIEDLSA